MKKPNWIKSVYDNEGRSFDQFTVVFKKGFTNYMAWALLYNKANTNKEATQ